MTLETAAHTAIAIVAMIGLTSLGLAVRDRLHNESLVPAIVTAAAGLLAAGGGVRACGVGGAGAPICSAASDGSQCRYWRRPADRAAGQRRGGACLHRRDWLRVLTSGLVTLTGRHFTIAAAFMTLCALGGIVAGARMWRPVHGQWLWHGHPDHIAAAAEHGGDLRALDRTHQAATLRLDHRPGLFRRSDGAPVDTVSPVEEGVDEDEPNPDTTPRGGEIAAAARRANQVLTGICMAAAASSSGCVWATLMPGRPRSIAAAVLAGLLFVLILISRGRAFADKWQSVALVIGAGAATCAGVANYVLDAPAGSSPLLWGASALMAFAAFGLLAALLPVHQVHPDGANGDRMARTDRDRGIDAAGGLDQRTVQLGADAMTWPGHMQRIGALVATLFVAMSLQSSCIAGNAAPSVDPSAVPPDGRPGPDNPMRQSNIAPSQIPWPTPMSRSLRPGSRCSTSARPEQYSTETAYWWR